MSSDMDGEGAAPQTIDARATLDAWRANRADRVNPARFRFIDALERRAANYDGDVRHVLDEKLATLIADYEAEVHRAETDAAAAACEPACGTPADAGSVPAQCAPRRGALAELVDLLASRARAATATTAAQNEASAARDALYPHRQDRSPDLPVLDYFRETWSKFSTEKQLRQSLEHVPDKAGPLNSNSLMHRALSLMRELSPGYLQQFLSYAEALSWMEQLAGPVSGVGSAPPPVAEIPRPGSAKKRARGKAR
ncbi:DUF2894 domain-containing protein [Trinickia dinghuensis]|uniref:DUF2894 domain-containing protein n=1 Tax=Trinickia dinghuensis TaxID=2291023 RepID=A0A3D8K0H1_9BURK|nr:DUF2894 domain-containing protein [Trinickia dinghuensis]RDU98788.1 DUF2894 domain-containing protein [Trinickia dinghuensis]